jgi:hypothetical protein
MVKRGAKLEGLLNGPDSGTKTWIWHGDFENGFTGI